MSEGIPGPAKQETEEVDDSWVKLAEGGFDALAESAEPAAPEAVAAVQEASPSAEAQAEKDASAVAEIKERLAKRAEQTPDAEDLERRLDDLFPDDKTQAKENPPLDEFDTDKEWVSEIPSTEAQYLEAGSADTVDDLEMKIREKRYENADTRKKIAMTGLVGGATAMAAGFGSFFTSFGTASAASYGIGIGSSIGLTMGGAIIGLAPVALAAGGIGWLGKKAYDTYKERKAIRWAEKHVQETRKPQGTVHYENGRFEVY